MDLNALRAALARALDPAEMSAALAKYPAEVASGPNGRAIAYSIRGQNIQAVLNEQPEFAGNLMIFTGQGAFQLAALLPGLLLRRADLNGADAAIEWLQKLLATDKAETWRVVPLWGIEIAAKIELSDGVIILPFDQLPESQQKDEINGALPSLERPVYAWQPPGAALMVRSPIASLFYNSVKSEGPSSDETTSTLLGAIRVCLPVIAPSAVVAGYEWTQWLDPDLADLACASGLTGRPLEIRPHSLRSYGTFDAEKAASIVQGVLKLRGTVKDRMSLALSRFDQAMRRHEDADAAMELAIALDALVGDGAGEATWKISLRSSLLLECDKAERVRCRTIVMGIYALRSRVVHTGRVSGEIQLRGGEKIDTRTLVREGAIYTARIIQSGIMRGNLPDWFEAELGLT